MPHPFFEAYQKSISKKNLTFYLNGNKVRPFSSMADSHGPAYLHTRYLSALLTQCRNSLLSMEDLIMATNKKRTNFLILNWHRFRRGRFYKRGL